MAVSWRRSVRKVVHVRNEYLRCFLAEFFGTMVLVFLIDAMAAHAVFNSVTRSESGAVVNVRAVDHVHLALGAAMAVMVGVLVSGGVSGAHLNPAVSGAFAAMGRTTVKKMLIYWAAQYLGAFVASAGLYGIYYESFNNFDLGTRQVNGTFATAHIFATYPAAHVSWLTAFLDQIVATAVLMFGILAIIDEKNWSIAKGLIPFYIGLLILSIVLSLGYQTGAAMNPARDLMPRLFTLLAGWGSGTFSVMGYWWFWVPILGSHFGAILGAGVYEIIVGAHWPDDLPVQKPVDDFDLQRRHNTDTPVFKVRPNGFGTPAQDTTDPSRALLTSPSSNA